MDAEAYQAAAAGTAVERASATISRPQPAGVCRPGLGLKLAPSVPSLEGALTAVCCQSTMRLVGLEPPSAAERPCVFTPGCVRSRQ